MRFTASDLRPIRWSLLAICSSAIVSALILYGSAQHAARVRDDHAGALQQLNDARRQLDEAHEARQNMAVYAGEYAALADLGVIGEDRRLDWMEGLENLRQQGLVTDFRYNIAPQAAYVPQPPVDSGVFDIRRSEMKLQFELLHEGQLLDFFAALRNQVKGRYLLEGCSMKRATEADAGAAIRLTAECDGGWITLKNRNGAAP